jgi:hypothetical protein
MNYRVLSLVKINTRISDTPCICIYIANDTNKKMNSLFTFFLLSTNTRGCVIQR